jgi:hypothetical protein
MPDLYPLKFYEVIIDCSSALSLFVELRFSHRKLSFIGGSTGKARQCLTEVHRVHRVHRVRPVITILRANLGELCGVNVLPKFSATCRWL